MFPLREGDTLSLQGSCYSDLDYFDLESYPFITYSSKAIRYPRRYVAHARCRVDGLFFK